ncbi:MAG: FAD-dependent oxidoreductase [Burkholderiaceae bacterium]|nr:FAD-dependent oxidoreductase [Burkholderiaceae bacterium]
MDAETLPDAAGGPCDVLVVGGGVYGACIAAACASVSLSTLLVERDRFGLGTSSASLRILHGGIRYLQNLDLRRIDASLRSRAWFAGLEPALVSLLDCTVPTRGAGLRSRAAMSVALRAYRLAASRSADIAGADGSIGMPRTSDARRAREFLTPWVGEAASRAFSGMARWPEMVLRDPVGMVEAIVRAARTAGAQAFDRIEVQAITPGTPVLVTLRRPTMVGTIRIAARAVILACGPAARSLLTTEVQRRQPAWLLGANLLWSPMRGPSCIVGVPAQQAGRVQASLLDKGHRDLFVLSDGGDCLVGTEYGLVPEGTTPDAFADRLADRLRVAVQTVFPGLAARTAGPGDVLWGWLPGDPDAARLGRVRLSSNAWVVEHAPGIWQVAGAKFVEAPVVAAGIASTVARRAGIGDDAVRCGMTRFWSIGAMKAAGGDPPPGQGRRGAEGS